MELLAVDMVSGEAEHVIRLPRQSYLPLITAAVTGTFFLSLLFKFYWLAPVALVSAVGCFLCWSLDTGSRHDMEDLPIGHGAVLPPHIQVNRPASWWAMALALIADATAFISLFFGGLFLWLSAPNWPPLTMFDVHVVEAVVIAGALLLSAVAGRAAVRRSAASGWLAITALGHIVATVLLARLLFFATTDAQSHAALATVFVVFVYLALHSALGAVFAVYGIWRVRTGYVSERRTLDLRLGELWHGYTAVLGIAAAGFPFVLAGLVEGVAP